MAVENVIFFSKRSVVIKLPVDNNVHFEGVRNIDLQPTELVIIGPSEARAA